ncbi:MAG: hypothetical protein AAGI22_19560 [Planctomycetota bacterium]
MAIAMPAAAFVQGAPPTYPLFDTDSDHATPGWFSLNHFGALDTRSFDYDGDEDLDVLTFFPAFNASHPAPQGGMYMDPHGNARWIRVWRNELNETSGGFPEVLPSDPDFPFDTSVQLDSPGSTQINGPYTMLLLDIDDDGFEDLVVANQRTYDCVFYWDDVTNRWGNHTRLYSTLPSGMPGGTAQPSAVMRSRNANPWDNGVADLCCIGDSSCTFPQAQSRFTVAMDTAHLNEDKFPDLVLGFRDHGPVVLLNNHGGWHPSGVSDPFVEVETLPVFPDESDWEYPNMANRVVVLGDLDGDGDADCIVGRSSSKTWQCQAAALDPQPSYVRKDDRLDAVRVYENVFGETGATGYFEPHSKLAPGADPAAVPPGAVTYLNLEPGNQGPSLGSPGSPSLQVHLADLNGDGIDDLVVPVQHSPRNWHNPGGTGTFDRCQRDYRTRVYLGDGTGGLGTLVSVPPGHQVDPRSGSNWSATPRYVPSYRIGTFAPTLDSGDNLKAAFAWPADFDNDGDLDLAIAHNRESIDLPFKESPGEMDRLWMNNLILPLGTGVEFSRLAPIPPNEPHPDAFPPMINTWHVSTGFDRNDNTRYIRAHDYNGDGALDWIESNFMNESQTLVSSHHVRIFLSRLYDSQSD